jgi:hypothetical protein
MNRLIRRDIINTQIEQFFLRESLRGAERYGNLYHPKRCHSRNSALDTGTASGILLETKKDSGQAGMTSTQKPEEQHEKKE